MIKINSLEFLNKSNFESDIIDSQGNVLVCAGEKITPELILKLYFKNIFLADEVKEEVLEKPQVSEVVSPEIESPEPPVVEEVPAISETAEMNIPSSEASLETESIDSKVPQPPEIDFEEAVDSQSDIKSPKMEVPGESTPVGTLYAFSDSSENSEVQKGPKAPSFDMSADGHAQKGPTLNNLEDDTNVPKGPKPAGFDLDEENSEKESKKGPVASQFTLDDIEKAPVSAGKFEPAPLPVQEPIEEKPPEPEFLEFNEQQAERIAKIAVELGKMLEFDSSEINKLKQSAYYCNIGLKKFRKEDLFAKDFDKKKAYASYEVATEEMDLDIDVTETIKNQAEDYDTTTFALNTQIPRKHIVGIVSYYEDMLMQNKTKQEVIDKMLQLGGNKFNIFVLHKFIRIMRESNG